MRHGPDRTRTTRRPRWFARTLGACVAFKAVATVLTNDDFGVKL